MSYKNCKCAVNCIYSSKPWSGLDCTCTMDGKHHVRLCQALLRFKNRLSNFCLSGITGLFFLYWLGSYAHDFTKEMETSCLPLKHSEVNERKFTVMLQVACSEMRPCQRAVGWMGSSRQGGYFFDFELCVEKTFACNRNDVQNLQY